MVAEEASVGQSWQGSHRALFLGWGRQPPLQVGTWPLVDGRDVSSMSCIPGEGGRPAVAAEGHGEATVRPLASCLPPAEGLPWLWAGWSHEQLTEGGRLGRGCLLLIHRVPPPPSHKQKEAGGREESGLEATVSCLLLCSLRSVLKRKKGA